MRNSVWKKMALLAFIWVFAAASCLSAYAGDFKLGYNTNASSNDYIFTTKAPKGNIGKSMSIPFRIRATDEDMNNLRVSLLETSDFQQIESSGENDYTIDYYPFEIMETTFTAKHVGNIKAGNVKSVSLSARVRRDAGQGYYSIPIQLEWDGGSDVDYINIWISTSASSSADDEEDKKEGNYFVVGENQSTPRGVYPATSVKLPPRISLYPWAYRKIIPSSPLKSTMATMTAPTTGSSREKAFLPTTAWLSEKTLIPGIILLNLPLLSA